MTVACGLAFQADCAWRLPISRFQPASHGSVPATARTLARLSSPNWCSMPGWANAAGAAAAVPGVAAVKAAPASATPLAAARRPRRVIPGVFVRLKTMPLCQWGADILGGAFLERTVSGVQYSQYRRILIGPDGRVVEGPDGATTDRP